MMCTLTLVTAGDKQLKVEGYEEEDAVVIISK